MRYALVVMAALTFFACGDDNTNVNNPGGTNETVIPQPPAPPADVRGFGDDHAVTLTWAPVTGATTYLIFISTAPTGPFTFVTNINVNTFTQVNLANDVTYYFRIRAANDAGESEDSAVVAATPRDDEPGRDDDDDDDDDRRRSRGRGPDDNDDDEGDDGSRGRRRGPD